MSEFVVYVLYSKKFEAIYIGYTSSLIQRFYSHNNFSKKGHTVKYRPWIVVYVEFYQTKKEALKREKQMKSYRGRLWIREFIKNNLID
jgi:putative endonuclease